MPLSEISDGARAKVVMTIYSTAELVAKLQGVAEDAPGPALAARRGVLAKLLSGHISARHLASFPEKVSVRVTLLGAAFSKLVSDIDSPEVAEVKVPMLAKLLGFPSPVLQRGQRHNAIARSLWQKLTECVAAAADMLPGKGAAEKPINDDDRDGNKDDNDDADKDDDDDEPGNWEDNMPTSGVMMNVFSSSGGADFGLFFSRARPEGSMGGAEEVAAPPYGFASITLFNCHVLWQMLVMATRLAVSRGERHSAPMLYEAGLADDAADIDPAQAELSIAKLLIAVKLSDLEPTQKLLLGLRLGVTSPAGFGISAPDVTPESVAKRLVLAARSDNAALVPEQELLLAAADLTDTQSEALRSILEKHVAKLRGSKANVAVADAIEQMDVLKHSLMFGCCSFDKTDNALLLTNDPDVDEEMGRLFKSAKVPNSAASDGGLSTSAEDRFRCLRLLQLFLKRTPKEAASTSSGRGGRGGRSDSDGRGKGKGKGEGTGKGKGKGKGEGKGEGGGSIQPLEIPTLPADSGNGPVAFVDYDKLASGAAAAACVAKLTVPEFCKLLDYGQKWRLIEHIAWHVAEHTPPPVLRTLKTAHDVAQALQKAEFAEAIRGIMLRFRGFTASTEYAHGEKMVDLCSMGAEQLATTDALLQLSVRDAFEECRDVALPPGWKSAGFFPKTWPEFEQCERMFNAMQEAQQAVQENARKEAQHRKSAVVQWKSETSKAAWKTTPAGKSPKRFDTPPKTSTFAWTCFKNPADYFKLTVNQVNAEMWGRGLTPYFENRSQPRAGKHKGKKVFKHSGILSTKSSSISHLVAADDAHAAGFENWFAETEPDLLRDEAAKFQKKADAAAAAVAAADAANGVPANADGPPSLFPQCGYDRGLPKGINLLESVAEQAAGTDPPAWTWLFTTQHEWSQFAAFDGGPQQPARRKHLLVSALRMHTASVRFIEHEGEHDKKTKRGGGAFTLVSDDGSEAKLSQMMARGEGRRLSSRQPPQVLEMAGGRFVAFRTDRVMLRGGAWSLALGKKMPCFEEALVRATTQSLSALGLDRLPAQTRVPKRARSEFAPDGSMGWAEMKLYLRAAPGTGSLFHLWKCDAPDFSFAAMVARDQHVFVLKCRSFEKAEDRQLVFEEAQSYVHGGKVTLESIHYILDTQYDCGRQLVYSPHFVVINSGLRLIYLMPNAVLLNDADVQDPDALQVRLFVDCGALVPPGRCFSTLCRQVFVDAEAPASTLGTVGFNTPNLDLP